jgi:hypothetical protein
MSMDPLALREMGANGRAWVASEFSWTRVAMMMAETYKWVSSGGTRPTWVQV